MFSFYRPNVSFFFQIHNSYKLWNRLGEKKQASSQFSRLPILVWRENLQMHNSRESRNFLGEENHISVEFCFFSFWILQLWFLSRKKQYGRNVFFEERIQNVCPQCSSVTVSAQWCFARSQLSNMWSYNTSYLHSCLYLSVLMCTVERACSLSAPAGCVRADPICWWCTMSHATVWHDTPSQAKCRVMLRWVMCHESAASGGKVWRSASLPNLGCPHHNNLSSIFL